MTDHDHMRRARELAAKLDARIPYLSRYDRVLLTEVAAALRSHSAQAVPDDAARLDWIKPGFRYLAGTHVEQVLWPDAKGNVTNQVNVPKGSGLRVAIDAAMSAAPKPEGR